MLQAAQLEAAGCVRIPCERIRDHAKEPPPPELCDEDSDADASQQRNHREEQVDENPA